MNARLVIALILLFPSTSTAQPQLCHLEGQGPEWHYRTQVGGKPWKCWYLGPRMLPRSQLYWAEVPSAPNIISPERPPWDLEPRWVDPTGRTHQE